jgi:hypothetical protein
MKGCGQEERGGRGGVKFWWVGEEACLHTAWKAPRQSHGGWAGNMKEPGIWFGKRIRVGSPAKGRPCICRSWSALHLEGM